MANIVFLNIFTVLFLWIVVSYINIQSVKSMPSEDFHIGHKDIGRKKGHLACQCDKLNKIMEKDLNIKTAQRLFQELHHEKDFLEKIAGYDEIKDIVNCSRCNLTYINCSKDLCIKKVARFSLERDVNQTTETADFPNSTVTFRSKESSHNTSNAKPTSNVNGKKNNESNVPKDTSSLNATKNQTVNDSKTGFEIPANYTPRIIEIPLGGHKNHSRHRRNIGCSYPSAMETAAISCRVYPSFIKCVQTCAFGYTLDNGIQKEMQCRFKDNRWIPSGFKECQPFVDCSVTLSSGGSAACATSAVDKAPACKIECLPYEDKPGVPMALYQCKIDGTWDPPLPFCVLPGSGMILAPAPRMKLKTDEKQPEKVEAEDKVQAAAKVKAEDKVKAEAKAKDEAKVKV